jgi:hypothetical protein
MNDSGWIDVGQVMLCLLRQVFRIPDPAAGFTGAGGFIMSQVLVQ